MTDCQPKQSTQYRRVQAIGIGEKNEEKPQRERTHSLTKKPTQKRHTGTGTLPATIMVDYRACPCPTWTP